MGKVGYLLVLLGAFRERPRNLFILRQSAALTIPALRIKNRSGARVRAWTPLMAHRYHGCHFWALPTGIIMDFEKFKQDIREELGIPEWQPTHDEIVSVYEMVQARSPHTKRELAEIVVEACKWEQTWGMEGIDNSDLNALLLMASQPRKTK